MQPICRHCQRPFKRAERAQAYCTDKCRTDATNARRRKAPDYWMNQKRTCRQCGREFQLGPDVGRNTQHCSDECARKSIRRSTQKFYELKPGQMSLYNRRRYEKHGRDTLLTRLYKKFTDLPKTCEASTCEEGRVLEAAHKPEFRRHGAHRTLRRYERHMFWMLCPTHHELIDRGICKPEEFGLS